MGEKETALEDIMKQHPLAAKRLSRENEHLRERIAQLERALKPFADHALWMEGCEHTDLWGEAVNEERTPEYHHLIVDDYFQARIALDREPGDE